MRRLAGVQYARAAAALGVVCYHACDRRGVVFGPGAAGVDVFFVISGFVIWVSAAGRQMSLAEFAWHRLARIVPLYWAATLVLAAGALLLPQVLPHLQPSPRVVLLSLLFIPFTNADGQVFPLLVSGWTLDYEMFFYTLFCASLLLREAWRLRALLGLLVTLTAVGLVLHPSGAMAFTYTNPLLLEFGAGMVLGQVWRTGGLRWPAIGLGLVGLGIALLAATGITGIDVAPWRAVLWGVPGVLIVTGVLAIEAGGRMPVWALPAMLGDASYSMYLLHPLVVSALLHWYRGPTWLFVVAAMVLSSAVGVLCFVGFERPVGRGLKRLRRRIAGIGVPEATALAGTGR